MVMSFYSQYTSHSGGRVLHTLEYYCNNRNYVDHFQLGNNTLILNDKEVATYEWEKYGDYDVPHFVFKNHEQADYWSYRQFVYRPFLDRLAPINLDYIIHEVSRGLTDTEYRCLLTYIEWDKSVWLTSRNLKRVRGQIAGLCEATGVGELFSEADRRHVALCAAKYRQYNTEHDNATV